MTMQRHCYGNPASFVKFESEYNKCKGCAYEMATLIAGKQHKYCNQGKKHGTRCKLFIAR